MRKHEIIKKIVENEDFKNKYWSDFQLDPKIADYSSSIIKSKNKFLLALLEIINNEKNTSQLLMKKIFNIFNV